MINSPTDLCNLCATASFIYTILFGFVWGGYVDNLPRSRTFKIGLYAWFVLSTIASIVWILIIVVSGDWQILFFVSRKGIRILVFIVPPIILYVGILCLRKYEREAHLLENFE